MNNEHAGWSGETAPGAELNNLEEAVPVPGRAAELWSSGEHRRVSVERTYLGWWPSVATFAQDLAVGLGVSVDGAATWSSFVEAVGDEYVVAADGGVGGVYVFEDPNRQFDEDSAQRIGDPDGSAS